MVCFNKKSVYHLIRCNYKEEIDKTSSEETSKVIKSLLSVKRPLLNLPPPTVRIESNHVAVNAAANQKKSSKILLRRKNERENRPKKDKKKNKDSKKVNIKLFRKSTTDTPVDH